MKFEVVANVYEWNDVSLNGALHIELDGKPFPEKHWSGSISEMLIMWAENLLSLLEAGADGNEEFLFLGSLYAFTIRRSGSGKAMLILTGSPMSADEQYFEVSFYGMISAVFFCIDSLTGEKRFEEVQQVKRLEKMAQRLKKASEAQGYHMD